MFAHLFAATGLIAAGCAWRVGRRQAQTLTLDRAELHLPHLPPALAGRRMLHLSDLHLRGRSRLEPLVTLIQQAAPDWVMITGDLVGGRGGAARVRELLAALSPQPVYCCLGNADYTKERSRRPDLAAWRQTGARILVNEAEPLPGTGAWIAAVDDPHRGRDDLPAALARVPPEAFLILLAHSPDILHRPGVARAALILCGHTHGGQVCLPGGFPPLIHCRVPRRFASGVNAWQGSTVVTSRGVGVTRIPVRLFCPPQATCWTLRSVRPGTNRPPKPL